MKYRVGRKQKRVILDENGHEVAICHKGKEEVAQQICDLLNEHGLVSKNESLHDVILSCYLFKVDGEDCFVLGENIADAIDRLEKEDPNAEYEMVHSKSLDCIY